MTGGAISFSVPGTPRGKARPRFGKGGRVYTPDATRESEASVAAEARRAMAGRPPIEGAVHVDVIATFLSKDLLKPWLRPPDADNLLKLAMDAMNGIVYRDDAQVTRARAEKRRGLENGWMITVRPVGVSDAAG